MSVLIEGQLRHLKTGEPFLFTVSEDKSHNQAHYEALGEVMKSWNQRRLLLLDWVTAYVYTVNLYNYYNLVVLHNFKED